MSMVRLVKELTGDNGGLGDAFCLTNPRVEGNPIAMVSPGFSTTTGYRREECTGRNRQFLEGPGTSASAIKRLRSAIAGSRPCIELVLLYRQNETPFYCLLSCIPLRDIHGQVVYFLEGLVDVTPDVDEEDLMSFLWKVDRMTGLSTASQSSSRPNPNARAMVADSPLMHVFKTGKPLSAELDIPQVASRWEGQRTAEEAPHREVIDTSALSTTPQKHKIGWLASRSRSKRTTEDSYKYQGSLTSRSDSYNPGPPVPIDLHPVMLESTYSRVESCSSFPCIATVLNHWRSE